MFTGTSNFIFFLKTDNELGDVYICECQEESIQEIDLANIPSVSNNIFRKKVRKSIYLLFNSFSIFVIKLNVRSYIFSGVISDEGAKRTYSQL